LVPFSSEFVVLASAIKKVKIKIYKTVILLLFMDMKLTSDIKGIKYV
jgi:hypothetical protein